MNQIIPSLIHFSFMWFFLRISYVHKWIIYYYKSNSAADGHSKKKWRQTLSFYIFSFGLLCFLFLSFFYCSALFWNWLFGFGLLNNEIRYYKKKGGFEIQFNINAHTEINSLAVTFYDRFYRECFSLRSSLIIHLLS